MLRSTSTRSAPTSAGQGVHNSFERQGEQIIRITDRSRSSIERLVSSIEKQAQAYGKTGVERLITQRDLLIRRLGDEQQAVDRVTSAYARMIEQEKRRGEGGVGGFGAGARAGIGARDLFENRDAYAAVEFGRGISELKGFPAILGAAAAGFAAFAAAGYEAAKSLGEYGTRVHDVELRTGLTATQVGQFGYAARAVGQDVSAVERTMRGLTEAISGDSAEAQKARDVLRGFGVDLAALREGSVPTSHVLQQISEGLSKLPTNWERNAAGMALFKRAGIELLPFMEELNENLDEARKHHFPDEADITRFRQYQRELTDIETEWNNLSLKFKEPLAATILFTLKTIGEEGPAAKPVPGLVLNTYTNKAVRGAVITPEFSTFLQGVAGAPAPPGANDAAIQAALARWGRSKQGLEAALSEAKKNETKALEELKDHDLRGLADLRKAEADILRIQNSLEASKGTEAKPLYPEPAFPYAGPGKSGLVPSLIAPGGSTLYSAPFEIYPQDIERANAPTDKAMLEQGLAQLKGNYDLAKRADQERQQAAKALLSYQEQMIRLQSGPGGELEVARKVYELRESGAKTELERYEIGLDYLKQQAEIQAQADQKHAEEMQRQHDEIARTATGLFQTLFTHPQNFGRQLRDTLQNAALRPVVEGLGNTTANILAPLFGGSGGLKDVRSTNGAMHVFVTNFAPGGGRATVPFSAGGGILPSISVPSFGGLPASLPFPSFRAGAAPMTLEGGSTVSLPYFGAGAPILGGLTQGGNGIGAPLGSDFGGNPASIIGPGGTAGFSGGLPLGIGQQPGIFGRIFGGATGGFGGFGGILGNLGRSIGYKGAGQWATGPMSEGQGFGGAVQGIAASPVGGMAGMFLAQQGLLGRNAGTVGGMFEGAAGGALIGMQYGGPIGAAIGAAAGFAAGLGEMLAGVEPQWKEAERLVKDQYRVSIDHRMGQQIADIANQRYAGHVSIAVRSPEVRQMLGIYAAGTGQSQNSLLSSTVPRAGSLIEQGGTLYQAPNYLYGLGYAYQSGLPVSGPAAGTWPNPAQNVVLNVNGQSAADLLEGRVASVVTPSYVSDQFIESQYASSGRTQAAANALQPGLIVS